MYFVRILLIDVLYTVQTSYLFFNDNSVSDYFSKNDTILMIMYIIDFAIVVMILMLFFIYANKAEREYRKIQEMICKDNDFSSIIDEQENMKESFIKNLMKNNKFRSERDYSQIINEYQQMLNFSKTMSEKPVAISMDFLSDDDFGSLFD